MSKAPRHRARYFGSRRLPVVGAVRPDDLPPVPDPRRCRDTCWDYLYDRAFESLAHKQKRSRRIKMSFKVSFTDGSWRIVDADVYSLDERLVVFLKDSEPILTAVVANVLFFEPVAPEPEKSSLDDAHYGLLFGR